MPHNNSNGKPRRLLTVDDDEIALEGLALGLRKLGFEVVATTSGAEALELARQSTFDLALVDLRMPGLSGFEVVQQLLVGCNCFSLVISGSSGSDDVEEAMRNGALGYLLKPIDVARLVPTINAAIIRARESSTLIRNNEQLTALLQEGREVSIAVGIFMERLRLDRQSAQERLRNLARSQRRRLPEVAREIVNAAEVLNPAADGSRSAKP